MKLFANPKRVVVNGVLAIAVLGGGAFAVQSTRADSTAAATTVQTETVAKGDVTSTVSASGNVVSSTDLSVSFQQSGRVTKVLVQEGDRVTVGQELAMLDDSKQKSAVTAAESSLASAKAKAAKTKDGLTSVERSQNTAQEEQSRVSVDAAKIALQNARETAETNLAALQASVDQANRNVLTSQAALDTAIAKEKADNDAAAESVENARKSLINAESNARRDNDTASANLVTSTTTRDDAQRQLDVNVANLTSAQTSFDVNAASYSTDLVKLVGRYTEDQTQCKIGVTSDGVVCANVAYLLQLAQAAQKQEATTQQAQSTLNTTTANIDATKAKGEQSIFSAQTSLTNAVNTQRTTKSSGESSVTNARNSVESAKEKAADAVRNQTSGKLKDQQTIRTQSAQVTSAERSLASQKAANAVKAKPATSDQIAADKSQVESAQNQLETAKENLTETVLRAPVAGVIANVNGALGDVAVGGTANAFLTITDPDTIKVKVGFSEADALRLSVGQNAKITLDSASERAFTGTVTGIDQTQTLVNNVVTYYADVDLVGDTAGVRTGMSASVEVIVAERKGVLTLPSRAVKGSAKTTTLRIQTPATDGAKEPVDTPTQVTVGLRGDERVEILSGLTEGAKVVVESSGSGGFPAGFTPPAGGPGGGGLGGGLG
jgi:RND family efflux transporter MFP subunit